MYAKSFTLYVLEILNVMRDYNEIYLSIFSVFHEIMLRDEMDFLRFLRLGGPCI